MFASFLKLIAQAQEAWDLLTGLNNCSALLVQFEHRFRAFGARFMVSVTSRSFPKSFGNFHQRFRRTNLM